MSTQEKYNGWTNYATWRINLELFDGAQPAIDFSYIEDRDKRIYAVQQYLIDATFEYIEGDTANDLVKGFAKAFVSEVNYYEIALHMIEEAEGM